MTTRDRQLWQEYCDYLRAGNPPTGNIFWPELWENSWARKRWLSSIGFWSDPPKPTPKTRGDVVREPASWRPSRVAEKQSLPSNTGQRKELPVYSGVFDYFPKALAYVSKVSKTGNDQHNPGQPLHWSKEKSSDHLDCIGRHLLDAGKIDPVSKLRESGFLAWRALANLQIELEAAEARGEKW